jgi:hypothetical protein
MRQQAGRSRRDMTGQDRHSRQRILHSLDPEPALVHRRQGSFRRMADDALDVVVDHTAVAQRGADRVPEDVEEAGPAFEW